MREACRLPTRLPCSSPAICRTTSHRLASAAKTSAFASAVSTTLDSSYVSDDSVTTPRTIAHLDARSDTSAGSPSVRIVPDTCSIVLSICHKSVSIPGASTAKPSAKAGGFCVLSGHRVLHPAPSRERLGLGLRAGCHGDRHPVVFVDVALARSRGRRQDFVMPVVQSKWPSLRRQRPASAGN